LTVKCVGNIVYVQLNDGFYKIDTFTRAYEKIQNKNIYQHDE